MGIRQQVARLASLLAAVTVGAVAFAAPSAAEPVFPLLAGANNPACVPSGGYEPVLLVHGSGTDAVRSFAAYAPALHAAGHCVFAVNLGRGPALIEAVSGQAGSSAGAGPIGAALLGNTVWGVADIVEMAGGLGDAVQAVRDRTGAAKVALVGHSTGGTVIRTYLREHGGAAVSSVVTLGSPYRGTTWAGLREIYPDLATLGLTEAQIAAQVFGLPGRQQAVGSPLLNRLNAVGETVPGVRYTAIASRADTVITPPDTALLTTAEGGNRNIWLQDGCPGNTADHGGLLGDERAIALVVAALTPEGESVPTLPCN
ncbi:lipase family alpha/beta hydrolase [Nocardia donostiensis]|uniref:Triacylglycerol lipase n=1 Tax=Nocardia donostiensis TaxID=1538463 RepID=A0A1V2TLW2_9NOCA|nr:alpha/beta fold hydrolase [Nocardia donostiensis]ONM50466.1 triacylglycerol lipase [Nocardia donostiensis]OQS17297.1 triacylglycerol lipase [Nocardia donostiensis]OQS18878.1 triacylglycerol lipase [Nocardia donostiensis]